MAKTSLALTRAPAASHARLKATKTPLKYTTRSKIDQKAEPDTPALDQAAMECQDSVAGDVITHQHNEETYGTSGGKERDDGGSWHAVLTEPQSRNLPPALNPDFPYTNQDAWSGRDLDPAAGEQGGGDGVSNSPNNISP
ncbi:hypothetical protein MRX96_034259 [Rhipicephalus microplus]